MLQEVHQSGRPGFAAGLAHTPVPLAPYRDADFFEREKDQVFRRAWLLLARVEELPVPGSYSVKPLPTFGSSVILTHTKGGAIRAFHNSCSHRGSEILPEGSGKQPRFVCPYHNWTYTPDGALVGVPDEADFPGLDKRDCGLKPVACDTWDGWVFVNLQREPEVGLIEYLGPMAEHLAGLNYPAAATPMVFRASLDANWKVVADAFIETYHIPFIHPRTIGDTFASAANPFSRLLDFTALGVHRAVSMYGNPEFQLGAENRVERTAYAGAATDSVIAAAASEGLTAFLGHPSVNPTGSGSWSMDVKNVFPHVHLDCGPGGFWLHHFWPMSATTCEYEVQFYVAPATTVRERFQQEMYVGRVHEIVLEDLANVARTQRGINSGGQQVMQLKDSEAGIRHHLDQILKWVDAPTMREALL
ncbi:MAG: aromatic ring-hydroxylating dioxygenase subunit alpha [Pseudomonadota bacterium]